MCGSCCTTEFFASSSNGRRPSFTTAERHIDELFRGTGIRHAGEEIEQQQPLRGSADGAQRYIAASFPPHEWPGQTTGPFTN